MDRNDNKYIPTKDNDAPLGVQLTAIIANAIAAIIKQLLFSFFILQCFYNN